MSSMQQRFQRLAGAPLRCRPRRHAHFEVAAVALKSSDDRSQQRLQGLLDLQDQLDMPLHEGLPTHKIFALKVDALKVAVVRG